jgi:hypothetical protein
LAGGEIEISQQGSGVWQTLPTQLDGSQLVARVDDRNLRGTYIARAVARDQAGNTTVTESTTAGQPMVLRLPLRIESRLSGGVARTRIGTRMVRRKGRRRAVRRRTTVYRSSARTRLGQRVQISGMLANRGGNPLPGAQIQIYSTPDGGSEQLAGVIQTDAKGRYRYTLRADRNRTLRLAYQGTPLVLPAERTVRLRVAAASTIRISKRRVPNGGRVVFSGRLQSLPVPAGGKILELQWRFRGADWGTFKTLRTDSRGRWRLAYRFSRIRSTVRLRFRARLRSETGYPFAPGGSHSRRITVIGGG